MSGLRLASAAVAAAGLGIAGYLTVVHYAGGTPVCAVSHGCATVQQSAYAELAGVPVALLGLVGLRRDPRLARARRGGRTDGDRVPGAGRLRLLGLADVVEVARLDAICIWCVGSAICMTLLAALSVTRMLGAPPGRPA